MTRGLTKAVWTDLRDLDAITKKGNLPAYQRDNVDLSQSFIVDNTTLYEMTLYDSSRNRTEPQACLNKRPGKLGYYIDSGVIDKRNLRDEFLTKLTHFTKGGSEYLKIELTFDKHGDRKLEYVCDPGLGYRFRELKRTFKGDVTYKVTAEDYKIIDGIPFPFTYTTTYYRDGKVAKQITKKVKEAKLNPVLTEKDFKLFLPKGTFVMEDILMKDTRIIESDGLMGIDDVLRLYADEVAHKELSNLTTIEDVSPTEPTELILPKIQSGKPKDKLFVLDLASQAVSMREFAGGLNSKAAYEDFLKQKKGDILWSGRILTVRDAEIIATKPDTLKAQKGKWAGACKVALGCTFTVQTKEKRMYEIVVLEIYDDGIKLRINNKIN